MRPAKISISRFAWFAVLLYAIVLAVCVAGWMLLGAPGDPNSTNLATVVIAASFPVLFGVVTAFFVLVAKGLIAFRP